MGHYHADYAAVFEVQVGAAGEEEASYVLMGSVPTAGPDAVDFGAEAAQFGAEGVGGLVVVELN